MLITLRMKIWRKKRAEEKEEEEKKAYTTHN